MKKILIVLLAAAILASAGIALAGVSGTPHDIRTTGFAGEPCAWCHTPHQGLSAVITPQYPLWNRSQAVQVYSPYTSNTFEMGAANAALDNGSATCMVCHNGVASTLVNYPGRGSVVQANYSLTIAGAWTNLGTDLQNEHPVSFTYNNALDSQNNGFPPSAAGVIGAANVNFPLYDPAGQANTPIQFGCATCHTVHHTPIASYQAGGNVAGGDEVFFLRTSNDGSGMCAECHVNRY